MYTPVGAVQDGPVMLARGASSTGQGGVGSYGSYAYAGGVHPKAHIAVIGWLLLAVAGIILLDKGGFRFVVTSTKR